MYYLGIDVGGMSVKVGIVDEKGNILLKDKFETGRDRSYEEIIRDIGEFSVKMIEKSGVGMENIKSVGIGIPGTPDCKNGLLVYANNLSFRNAPFRADLKKYFDCPIYIDNDANVAALAEAVAGVCKGVSVSMTITLGTGIGSGLVIDGKIFGGFNYAAPEIGHMVIVQDGYPCTCGRYGCWEAYASATGLIRMTREYAQRFPDSEIHRICGGDLSKVDARTAFKAKRAGDFAAKLVIQDFTKYLATGIVNLINLFQPEVLAVGGGLSHEGDYLMDDVKKIVYSEIYSKDPVPQCRIEYAKMGNDAGIVGAAFLGL
ncbi:MAG: ROK family protein [Clostridia bacterium]|jgi:glucokinase|nr:ROK family protein [Clostridiaceae bacterium]